MVEGWYGQPYPKPLARTREYVSIVRQVLAREAPVTFAGQFYRLPLPADEGSGLGKALRSTVHPLRSDLPIHLAAEGPRNIAMSAEIADGWLPLFYSPRMDGEYRTLLAEGFAKRAAGLSPVEDFEVVATVPVVLGADVESAADSVRPFIALYAGGMGAKGANFHRDVLDRLGYADACDEIQAHYLAGDRARATGGRAARAGAGHRAGRHRRGHPRAAARLGGHGGHDHARPGRPADAPGDRRGPAPVRLTSPVAARDAPGVAGGGMSRCRQVWGSARVMPTCWMRYLRI